MTEFVVAFDTNKSSQVGIEGIVICFGVYIFMCSYFHSDVRQVVLERYIVNLVYTRKTYRIDSRLPENILCDDSVVWC